MGESSATDLGRILDEAQNEDVDLIVMGTRGTSAAERWLIGTVSTKVLHHARCSVLVARRGAEAAPAEA